nr:MAG TPA: Putative tail fiber protein fold, Tail fiber, receptor [Caudoviricetes sp.]
MSILKSIMHHWNKTTKSYDTLHPETESAQITDWHSGIMASLASKTLGTVVDAITTDSVLGKLIKMLLDASGVKYLIDTNGYVCLGSFFGGLIIQWGLFINSTAEGVYTYSVAFTNAPLFIGTAEYDAGGWDSSTFNGIALSGAELSSITNEHATIKSKWVTSSGIYKDSSAVRVLMVGI